MALGTTPFTPFLTLSYSKLGFAGNTEPQYTFPTLIATREQTASTSSAVTTPSASGGRSSYLPSSGTSNITTKRGLEDLDYFIGDDAVANGKFYTMTYPMRHGQVENWDYMERFWAQSIFKYLRCEPEDHYFLLVLMVTNREDRATAECAREQRNDC